MNELTHILEANHYCNLASVQADGSPRNTPLHFAFDETAIYWISKADTVHCQNIASDKRVFVTIYSSAKEVGLEGRGAVYIQSVAEKLTGDEAAGAIAVYVARFESASNYLDGHDIYRVPVGNPDASKTLKDRLYFKYEVAA